MVGEPGSSPVFRATPLRLLRETLAPPPPPPRQLPTLRQTVPVRLGRVIVLLAVGVLKPSDVVKPPKLALRVLVEVPCKLRT
jgi:hypothetical protein